MRSLEQIAAKMLKYMLFIRLAEFAIHIQIWLVYVCKWSTTSGRRRERPSPTKGISTLPTTHTCIYSMSNQIHSGSCCAEYNWNENDIRERIRTQILYREKSIDMGLPHFSDKMVIFYSNYVAHRIASVPSSPFDTRIMQINAVQCNTDNMFIIFQM